MTSNLINFVTIAVFVIVTIALIVFGIPQSAVKITSGQQEQQQPKRPQYQPHYISSKNSAGISSGTTKLVMLTFGDTLKGQIATAKPILDKYGFKASFFITCDWVGLQRSKDPRLTWQDILSLQKDGQDIESKTMTHRDMSHLSAADLNFEIAQSKKCLSDHGINSTIFATPHGDEWTLP